MELKAKKEILKVEDLSVKYGPIYGLKNCSLKVKEGEIVALVGANGAGKSSTLEAIVGNCTRAKGKIYFNGYDTTNLNTPNIVRLGVALCPEGRGIFSEMSVKENLMLGGYHKRKKIDINLEKVFGLFPILKDRYNQIGGTMSGGEQQMLSIGRALMSEPKMLLLDEPSLGLAPSIIGAIYDAVKTLCEKGLSVLVAEERTNVIFHYAKRAYVMRVGNIIMEKTPEELNSNNELGDAYLGGNHSAHKQNE